MKREILDHLPESPPGSDDDVDGEKKSDVAGENCDKKDEDADGDKEMILDELKEVNGKDPVQLKESNGELANGHHNGTVSALVEDADMNERNENEAPKTNEPQADQKAAVTSDT